MKFDEIPATTKNGKQKIPVFIIVLAIIIVIVIVLVIYSINSANSNKVVPLDTNSRLVQSLYTSVHDFKSTSPYWMYDGENSSEIKNMTEQNKMVLAYLNLKASDFQQPDDCTIIQQENYYGKLVCNDKTLIDREDVERSYKEVFGDKAIFNAKTAMKVNPKDETYVYNSELDAYILYSSATATDDKFSKTYKYNYKVYQAEKQDNVVRIYEELTVEKVATGTTENQSKYLYTFVLGDDNLYNYTSIEKIA